MSRDLPRTLLPLDRWAEILGIDPRHFRQVTTSYKPVTTCTQVWKQYAWQESGQVGRRDVAQAIQEAENIFAQMLGYKLLPFWENEERQLGVKPGNPELLRYGLLHALQADWGYFIEAGIEAKSLIDDAVAIVYSDEDADGYFETATITFATTVTDDEEIAVFYPGESGADEWEIRPLRTVSIAGGVCTVTMWRHQLALPDLIEALAPEAVDGDVNGNFLTTVDVYRRYNDPSSNATLVWAPIISDCDSGCGETTQTACLTPRDSVASWLSYRPATWDADDEEWDAASPELSRDPDQVLLYYRAGLRDNSQDMPHLQMTPKWERAVAYYALTLLDRDICECAPVKAIADRWREDLAHTGPGGGSYRVAESILENPLGTTRAAIYAWNLIKQEGHRIAKPVRY